MAGSARRRLWPRIALLAFTSALALLACELVLRAMSGYRLFAWGLQRVGPARAERPAPDLVAAFADRHAARDDLDAAWLSSSPPPVPPFPVSDELRDRFARYPERIFLYHVNEVLLRSLWVPGKGISVLQGIPQPDSYLVFSPPDGLPVPRYRYPPHTTLPTGLTTNAFGFRGHDVALNKPERTVRIACVGASTTVSEHRYPHSYPELLEHWLGLWARRQGLDLRFEVLNAGREAIRSPDIAAIVRHEVLPLAVDYVVYYEGANQMHPPVLARHVKIEGDYELARPPAGLVPELGALTDRDPSWFDSLCARFATAEWLRSVLEAGERWAEPPKPPQRVTLPPELDERHPDPALADRVLAMGRILADLDAMQELLDRQDARLVLCSFCWLVEDGMDLDPLWNRNTFIQLNRAFWPFSYATLRRLVDLENRFLAAWAADRGVDFIDLAAELPADERLYTDAIHNTPLGVRLRAWLVFEHLTQVLRRDLERGVVPVPDPVQEAVHPGLGPVRTLTAAELDGR